MVLTLCEEIVGDVCLSQWMNQFSPVNDSISPIHSILDFDILSNCPCEKKPPRTNTSNRNWALAWKRRLQGPKVRETLRSMDGSGCCMKHMSEACKCPSTKRLWSLKSLRDQDHITQALSPLMVLLSFWSRPSRKLLSHLILGVSQSFSHVRHTFVYKRPWNLVFVYGYPQAAELKSQSALEPR